MESIQGVTVLYKQAGQYLDLKKKNLFLMYNVPEIS